MFKRKIEEIFKELPNVCNIIDDILVVDYESNDADHDSMLHR